MLVLGVTLVCSSLLPMPLRCFKAFLEVRTVAADDNFLSIVPIVPQLEVAAFLDVTFVFLVDASALGVARDFGFAFFVPDLAGRDAVGFCFFDAFFMVRL